MFNLFKSPLAKTISPSEGGIGETLFFAGKLIAVERHSHRRRMVIRIELDGTIIIRAAKNTPQKEMLDFLNDKKSWLLKLAEKNELIRDRYPRKLYIEGEEFLFCGKIYKLHYEEARGASGEIFLRDDFLVVAIPQMAKRGFRPEFAHLEMTKTIRDFYKHHGSHFIENKTKELAEKMELFPKAISFRSQKTRWGSCTSQGHLSFNWRLIVAPKEVIEYVIVHELGHLRHMNHSQNFWNLIEVYVPNYRELKRWLHDNQYETDFLAKKSVLWGSDDDM